MRRFIMVDPRTLYVTSQRADGADPWKLQRQIAAFGASTVGMIPVLLEEDSDGLLRLIDGVTRATRIIMISPGTRIPAEISATIARPFRSPIRLIDLIP